MVVSDENAIEPEVSEEEIALALEKSHDDWMESGKIDTEAFKEKMAELDVVVETPNTTAISVEFSEAERVEILSATKRRYGGGEELDSSLLRTLIFTSVIDKNQRVLLDDFAKTCNWETELCEAMLAAEVQHWETFRANFEEECPDFTDDDRDYFCAWVIKDYKAYTQVKDLPNHGHDPNLSKLSSLSIIEAMKVLGEQGKEEAAEFLYQLLLKFIATEFGQTMNKCDKTNQLVEPLTTVPNLVKFLNGG